MACPYNNRNLKPDQKNDIVTYSSHLKLDVLLSLPEPLSDVHDEYMFITTHQVYELWFQQIIREIDSIRDIIPLLHIEKRKQLTVNSRLTRIVKIWNLIIQQFEVLETMTPCDFVDIREHLKSASGYQSFQFRIIENKFGVRKENRITYNKSTYSSVFKGKQLELVKEAEQQPSLFDLIQVWLENVHTTSADVFNFWHVFSNDCHLWFQQKRIEVEEIENDDEKQIAIDQCKINERHFQDILQEENYEILRSKGARHLSWKALQGALMIYYYRDELPFHEVFQMLALLMDIDSLIIKWRACHITIVHRQLGTKTGTFGTSGYQYLRATVSDRYKAFLDLFNLSSYLIPSRYISCMDETTRKQLLEAHISS